MKLNIIFAKTFVQNLNLKIFLIICLTKVRIFKFFFNINLNLPKYWITLANDCHFVAKFHLQQKKISSSFFSPFLCWPQMPTGRDRRVMKQDPTGNLSKNFSIKNNITQKGCTPLWNVYNILDPLPRILGKIHSIPSPVFSTCVLYSGVNVVTFVTLNIC